MSSKRNFLIGIMDDTKICEVNHILEKYATMTWEYPSYMFFSKQPIDDKHNVNDITLFQLEAENESILDEQLDEIITELNALNGDYVLCDDDTKEMIVAIDHLGKLIIRFDNVKMIPKGTFEKINQLKHLKTEFGYCKGFKPKFRPIEGNSIENLDVNPEIIYLISDCEENLLKLKDHVSEKVLEIDSDFVLDFKIFKM